MVRAMAVGSSGGVTAFCDDGSVLEGLTGNPSIVGSPSKRA
jgi:hypothetical protein